MGYFRRSSCCLTNRPSAQSASDTQKILQSDATFYNQLSLFIFRCYNCGGLDHHAKECSLPPQPKKCHYCQSIMHMVANCPHKTVSQQPTSSQGRHEAEPQPSTSAFLREGGGTYGYSSPSYSQEGRSEISERSGRSPQEASSSKLSASPEEPSRKGPSVQKRKKT